MSLILAYHIICTVTVDIDLEFPSIPGSPYVQEVLLIHVVLVDLLVLGDRVLHQLVQVDRFHQWRRLFRDCHESR